MRLAQCSDFFDAIATNGIRKIFLCIFEPRIKRRSFLGKGQVQFLDLSELVLHAKETLLPRFGISQKFLPPGDDIPMTRLDVGSLIVTRVHQHFLQSGDVVDTLVFERQQTRVERVLLCEQSLHGGQVPSEFFRPNVRLFVRDPGLHDIRLPHELQVRRIVVEPDLPSIGQSAQLLEFCVQLVAALTDGVGAMIARLYELLSGFANVLATLAMGRKVRLESFVLLQQALHRCHSVAVILDREQLLLLGDPSFLLLDLGQELLVREGLVELLASRRRQLLELGPSLVQEFQALLDLGHAQIRHVHHEVLARFLDGLNRWFVAAQFSLQSLVLFLQVLNAGQVATVIVGADEELLLFDPRFFVCDVAEELMKSVGFVEATLPEDKSYNSSSYFI